jgi:hypothetical protein
METKTTPPPWYAVEYAGDWVLQSVDMYGPDDLLSAENVGKELAEANAKLAASAPILKLLVEKQEEWINELILTIPISGDYTTALRLQNEIEILKQQL